MPVHVILGILSRSSIQTHFVPKELTSSCKWCLLGLYLNLFRLVVLLIFSGTLFHNVGQMKNKALWPVLVLQKGYWRFWYSLSLQLKFVDYAYTLHLDVAYIISFVELGGNWSIVSACNVRSMNCTRKRPKVWLASSFPNKHSNRQ